MTTNNYLTNWLIFIDYIVSLFDSVRDETAISREFSGQSVEREGCIAEIKLGEGYSPGAALAMKPEALLVSNGKVLRADHLFLNTNEKTRSSWSDCTVRLATGLNIELLLPKLLTHFQKYNSQSMTKIQKFYL